MPGNRAVNNRQPAILSGFMPPGFGVVRELGMDINKINPHGGISLGHPIGCTGARILVTFVHEMVRRDLRLAWRRSVSAVVRAWRLFWRGSEFIASV